MGHLRAVGWRLVELEFGLIFPIDRLVRKQPGSRNHRGRHAVSDKDDDVFSLFAVGEREDLPNAFGLGAIVVGEHNII